MAKRSPLICYICLNVTNKLNHAEWMVLLAHGNIFIELHIGWLMICCRWFGHFGFLLRSLRSVNILFCSFRSGVCVLCTFFNHFSYLECKVLQTKSKNEPTVWNMLIGLHFALCHLTNLIFLFCFCFICFFFLFSLSEKQLI